MMATSEKATQNGADSPFLKICRLSRIERADERTRTADLLQLRVMHQALQGCAGGCKCRIFRGVSLLCLAPCCTVLRSRWCQSGVNTGIAYQPSQSLILRVLTIGVRDSPSFLAPLEKGVWGREDRSAVRLG